MKNGIIVDYFGTKEYYLNDELHRVDGPAQEYTNGSKAWYLNGEVHRVDGPAIEYANGTKEYYMNGKLHSVDNPAKEFADGTKFWWLNGKKHRVDGPAEEWANGGKYWYLNGKQLVRPNEFKNMESWFEKLNTDEEYSLPWINDINCLIEFINNPTPKQKRLNAMKWNI